MIEDPAKVDAAEVNNLQDKHKCKIYYVNNS